ncbi:alpha/beta hydrolase [Altererythrobacter aquiaggeris]|uniref:alpha/beta fold hydrolase n=1 Tax=Aestuarierythrobacter aquiaggeris TaxID=1898396 RepID=UPI003015E946
MDQKYTDGFWTSPDGLKLHFRDYPGREDRPPVICLPGLTRNARDFADLADRISGDWRVICVDNRGRAESDYAKDSATYNPVTYVSDLLALLEQERITKFVSIGTSLGGLMTMLLAAMDPSRLAGVLLNDIGPELDPAGLARISGYVGQGRSFETWMHAARALGVGQGDLFPDFDINDWLTMAKRNMCVGSNGRIAFDYDMKIAEPIAADKSNAAPPDLWPAYEALSGRPVTILRGELSDLFSQQTFEDMCRRIADADCVTVPRVGHAPFLDEPASVAAIDRLLERVR